MLWKIGKNQNIKFCIAKNWENHNMQKFTAGKYKQQQEYRSFTPSFVNNRFIWDNPQMDVLLEQTWHSTSAKNAHKLLQSMFVQPIVNANWAIKELGMAFSSANLLLKSLAELGILKETTDYSRNRLFVLEEYLNLFRD